jgi:hypothetical protein
LSKYDFILTVSVDNHAYPPVFNFQMILTWINILSVDSH